MFDLEICANSYTSALAAQNGGAKRIELCDNMFEGGTTPSYAQIKLCKENLSIQVWPIIRPRGGDFLYSNIEFNLMKEDVKICKSLGCDGVVIGILNEDGEIDTHRCAELIALAKPMPVAFHRAFDMSKNLFNALEDLINLGIVRVFTSGAAANAIEGKEVIGQLVKQANDRIEIMPGAGVNPQNIKQLLASTAAKTVHSSARVFVKSKMKFRNTNSTMGNETDEFQHQQTAVEIVKQLIESVTSTSLA